MAKVLGNLDSVMEMTPPPSNHAFCQWEAALPTMVLLKYQLWHLGQLF